MWWFDPYIKKDDKEFLNEIEEALDSLIEKGKPKEEMTDRCPKCGKKGVFIKMALCCPKCHLVLGGI